jgi:hypothetical protein
LPGPLEGAEHPNVTTSEDSGSEVRSLKVMSVNIYLERVREHRVREHPEEGIEDEHVHNLIEATDHDDAEDNESRPWQA